MKVIKAFPPNYREINAAFNVRGRQVIFAFGDKIFNPSGVAVTPSLMAHEEVHSRQQGSDPIAWWNLYVADQNFRLEEEIPAHVAEYAACNGDRRALRSIAERLASPLYGSLISYDRAVELIAGSA